MKRATCVILGVCFWLAAHPLLAAQNNISPEQNASGLVTAVRSLLPEQQRPDHLSFQEKLPDWKARWELAKVLSYAKHYDQSIAEYRTLLKKKPELLQAKTEMAKVMVWAGKQDQARQVLESIPQAELGPKAKLNLADIYTAQKKYSQAVPIYQEYLKKNPQADQVRLQLAQVLSWMSRYQASIHHYDILIHKRPKDVQLRRQYAQVLTWAKRYEQAIEQFRISLQN